MRAKRVFDLLLAVPAALLLLLPMLLIGCAVRLDSPGPALFRQQRIGRHGRPFAILKFRTMRHGAEGQGPAVTAGGDDRITRCGRWLRRHKLDELPQLFNVIGGSMSLVGPRPEVPRYVERYPAASRALILSVPPGITARAALAYRDEEALLAGADDAERCYLERVLPAKLALDEDYVRNRSLAGDCRILLDTLLALYGKRRAP
ncbi:sugar transferase [Chitinimonas koreensis]|uniref:sugar transferase n=1 Tax=Chitinimonas koreensis TaxID=356302 RepID=UPI000491E5B4|nr:sugar transferase [Chitinimonas koreensis]QNM97361.1 sugar transferase [Chitinimonas koreensis]